MTKEQLLTPCISFYAAPVTNKAINCQVSVLDVHNYICHTSLSEPIARLITNGARLSGKASGIVEATATLRSFTDAKQKRDYKAACFSYVTPSGTFGDERNDQSLIKHSSILCLDFDHLTPECCVRLRQQLIDDPYFETELMFTSPSGDGLKAWVEIDLNVATHREWFTGIRNYLRHTYEAELDSSGINPSRACFLPFDPNAYINPIVFQ